MRRSHKALRALSAAALVATGLAVTVNPAAADDVECGDVITQDTTLHEDIGPCPGTGLIVRADGVHLDLGGYAVTGENGEGDTIGILVSRVSGVHVLNGTVQGFDAGVVIREGGANMVHDMTVQDNVNDFSLEDQTCDAGDGITMINSDGNSINMNNVLNNGPYGGITLLGDSDDNVIENNKVEGNDIASPAGSACGNTLQDEGIRVEGPGADDNTIHRNTVLDSLLSGIGLHGHVCAPLDPSVPPDDPNTGNVITNNFVRNTAGTSIAAGINFLQQGPAGVVCPSFGNTIRRNISVANESDGIFVAASSADNLFDRNFVQDNGLSGIFLNGPRIGTNFENLGPTVFDVVDPDLDPYVEGTDFDVMFGSGSGDLDDVEIVAIDLAIPNDDPINPNPVDTSTSACEADDFTDAGFMPGDVALIQRGTCTFVLKVDNAIEAGASAVVMFNEGQTGRTESNFGSVGPVGIPVLSADYAVGQELADLIETETDPVLVDIETNTVSELFEAAPGAHDNTLLKNVGQNNGEFDGFDGNLDPPCDNNEWRRNVFGTVNQPCVSSSAVVPDAAPQANTESSTGSASAGERGTVTGIGRGASAGSAASAS